MPPKRHGAGSGGLGDHRASPRPTKGEVRPRIPKASARQKRTAKGPHKGSHGPSSQERCNDARASFWRTLRCLILIFGTPLLVAICTVVVRYVMVPPIKVQAQNEHLRWRQSRLEDEAQRQSEKISRISERLATVEGKLERSEQNPYEGDRGREIRVNDNPACACPGESDAEENGESQIATSQHKRAKYRGASPSE
ncbi:MAG: hypothetical protein JSU70_08055 [Phycisphaerales bacterium]|nr:MAG: hypothetical protein JSU70_08055 [Phycisphaerales bacterium]